MLKYFCESYSVIARILSSDNTRSECAKLRRMAYADLTRDSGFTKIAFDTRRVDQAVAFVPRRNLQNYHRSEKFVGEEVTAQINSFMKVKKAMDTIKARYAGHPAWLDSYCRVLSATVDSTLRVDQKDGDFSKSQMDYLNELLYVRYRINPEELATASEEKILNTILAKDESLMSDAVFAFQGEKQEFNSYGVDLNKSHVSRGAPVFVQAPAPVQPTSPQEFWLDKLIGEVKANKDNKIVERTITITIKDSVANEEDIEKKG